MTRPRALVCQLARVWESSDSGLFKANLATGGRCSFVCGQGLDWTFWGATMWPQANMITALLRGIVPVELLS